MANSEKVNVQFSSFENVIFLDLQIFTNMDLQIWGDIKD